MNPKDDPPLPADLYGALVQAVGYSTVPLLPPVQSQNAAAKIAFDFWRDHQHGILDAGLKRPICLPFARNSLE